MATEVIEHIPDHNRFLNEVCRVLRPDGCVVLSIVNRLQFSNITMGQFFRNSKIRDGHISKVTPMKLKKELKNTGLIVESLDYGAFNPYIPSLYFFLFREYKFINIIYEWLDKMTNFRMLKSIFKWDMINKSTKKIII